jgi:pantoate--beta-alanine ligase
VARLLGLFRPQVAVFGRKDYQQAVLVSRMVKDLELGVEIAMGPIVREADGLALSSRNVFLSGDQRADALGLSWSLRVVQKAFDTGVRSGSDLGALLAREIGKFPGLRLQYGEIVHPESLEPLEVVGPGAVAAVAAHCGSTRLIDNQLLGA